MIGYRVINTKQDWGKDREAIDEGQYLAKKTNSATSDAATKSHIREFVQIHPGGYRGM
jgi:hypothetical protein